MYIDIGKWSQGIPKNQGSKKEENSGPKYRNGRSCNYILLIGFGIIKTKKSGFHSVGQNHVEEYHPRQKNGNFTIIGCG